MPLDFDTQVENLLGGDLSGAALEKLTRATHDFSRSAQHGVVDPSKIYAFNVHSPDTGNVSRRFFPPWAETLIADNDQGLFALNRPIRVAVVTSIRDVGADDGVNSHVRKGDESSYLEGTTHTLMKVAGSDLVGKIEMAGVMVDDIEGHDKLTYPKGADEAMVQYSVLPEMNSDHRWIVPEAMGQKLLQNGMVVNIPSSFRLTKGDPTTRRSQKGAWEEAVVAQAEAWNADIILSDHCMVLFDKLHQQGRYAARVINAHPAIAWIEDPERIPGAFPTRDALRLHAEAKLTHTGATLHFIDRGTDTGPPVYDSKSTRIEYGWNPAQLRLANYKDAKAPVATAGMAHLAQSYGILIFGNALQQGIITPPAPVYAIGMPRTISGTLGGTSLRQVGRDEILPDDAVVRNCVISRLDKMDGLNGGNAEGSDIHFDHFHSLLRQRAARGLNANPVLRANTLKALIKKGRLSGSIIAERNLDGHIEPVGFIIDTPIQASQHRKGGPLAPTIQTIFVVPKHDREQTFTEALLASSFQAHTIKDDESDIQPKPFFSLKDGDRTSESLLVQLNEGLDDHPNISASEGIVALDATEWVKSAQKTKLPFTARLVQQDDLVILAGLRTDRDKPLLSSRTARTTTIGKAGDFPALALEIEGEIKGMVMISSRQSVDSPGNAVAYHLRTVGGTTNEEKQQMLQAVAKSFGQKSTLRAAGLSESQADKPENVPIHFIVSQTKWADGADDGADSYQYGYLTEDSSGPGLESIDLHLLHTSTNFVKGLCDCDLSNLRFEEVPNAKPTAFPVGRQNEEEDGPENIAYVSETIVTIGPHTGDYVEIVGALMTSAAHYTITSTYVDAPEDAISLPPINAKPSIPANLGPIWQTDLIEDAGSTTIRIQNKTPLLPQEDTADDYTPYEIGNENGVPLQSIYTFSSNDDGYAIATSFAELSTLSVGEEHKLPKRRRSSSRPIPISELKKIRRGGGGDGGAGGGGAGGGAGGDASPRAATKNRRSAEPSP